MIKPNWDIFKAKFSENRQENFEWLCYIIFCKEFDKPNGIFRYKNQSGIETNPINIGNEVIGFQSKFYEGSLSDHKDDLISTIKKSNDNYPSITKIILYTNSEFGQGKGKNPPKAQTEAESVATSLGITIEWRTKSYFETSQVLQENPNIASYFFTNNINLENDWFSKQNENAILDLDARYTPEINVKTDLLNIFNFLSRNDYLKEQFENAYHNLGLTYNDAMKSFRQNQNISSITWSVDTIPSILLKPNNSNENFIIFIYLLKINKIFELFKKHYQKIHFNCIEYIDFKKLDHELRDIYSIVSKFQNYLYNVDNKKYDYNRRKLSSLESEIHEFAELCSLQETALINNPYMILHGEAGIGKSHVLADVVKLREQENSLSLLLLGQHFNTSQHPWRQILSDLLRLNCNENEFLEALNIKAQYLNKRILIFIDAINEGQGKSFWNNTLRSFINSFKEYPWLGLVLSIRSSYFDLIVPQNLIDDNVLINIEHTGFSGIEYEASKQFFEFHKIEQPSFPFMHPEFQNPLFLKIFCKGLENKGLHQVPKGMEGITSIINFFIESIELKLTPKYHNIKSLRLLNKIIDSLIKKLIGYQAISYDKAYEIVEQILSKYRLESGILDDLVSEGLFSKNLFFKDGDYIEGIYFSYERFHDHLTVKYLFDNFLDKNNPKDSFENNEEFFRYYNVWKYQGTIEAMSIQLPELTKEEFHSVIPTKLADDTLIKKAFFHSLLWRKNSSITERTIQYIKSNLNNKWFRDEFFEIAISIASIPEHPFNALFIHDYLFKFSMADRDSWFILFLEENYSSYEMKSVKRIINWSLSSDNKQFISNKSILLTCIILSWFLSSSNREIRDTATKALVNLLKNRTKIIIELLQLFQEVNDPYIYERLFAAAFGSIVNSNNSSNEEIKNLALYTFETIFDADTVYPNILLRDFAKLIIDYTLSLNIDLDIDISKTIPPYKSYFPDISDLPTNDDIDKIYNKDDYNCQGQVVSSMYTEYGRGGIGGYGDFGRYVFGYAVDNFVDKKDEQLISNYATKKIFDEYSYTKDKFENVEKELSKNKSYSRYENKTERIGKKYQWLAMYDTLARLSDNFPLKDDRYFGEKKTKDYLGTFQLYIRSIDPTILIKSTKKDRDSNNEFWWNPKVNIDWNENNELWVSKYDDFPDIKDFIELKDDNQKEWIALNSLPEWVEPIEKGIDRWDIVHKNIWSSLKSYLIPKEDLEYFKSWAEKQNFWGNWMPDAKENTSMYFKEYYWSKAYEHFQDYYYGCKTDWDQMDEHGYGKKIALTTENYFWEKNNDYSKNDTINILCPSKIIFDGLSMQYSDSIGIYTDINSETICFEPSVSNKTFQCLLINKAKLIHFLEKNDLTIVWINIAEKRPNTGHNHDFLGTMEISQYYYFEDRKIHQGKTKIMYMDKNHNQILKEVE
jgi:hypothetical protein